MEPDAALYASISKTIVLKNDWINLYVNNLDWLDKPHLTFWIGALSFKLFGISAFAYKLPSFIISLIGFWYVFKLAKAMYNRKVGLIAVIISMTALHYILSNYDVRAEGYLTAFILAAIYHFYKAHNSSFIHIVLAAFFTALAVMVKGIFVVVPVFGGFVIYWLWTKQFFQLMNWRWFVAIALMALFILPELYALYLQFDLHPEKVIFGEKNVSGLRFFFWDSQFGRFFNNGPIKGRGEPTFFIHTTLWAFLPWTIPFVAGLFQLSKRSVRQSQGNEVVILWGSAALTFVIFSLSKFQLPHYIIILFPQFSIITANYLYSLTEKQQKIFGRIHTLLGIAIVFLLSSIVYFMKVEHEMVYYLVSGIIVSAIIVFSYSKRYVVLKNATLTAISILVFLYGFFYPTILKYQSGSEAAKWLNQRYPELEAATFDYNVFAFDFYANGIVAHYDLSKLSSLPDRKKYAFYVHKDTLKDIEKNFKVSILKGFDYFRITKMKPKFLNFNTRAQVLDHFYLITIN